MPHVKRNGFSFPYNAYQLSAWLGVLYSAFASYFSVIPAMPSLWSRFLFASVFTLSHSSVLLLGLWATASDPTDAVVYLHRKAVKDGTPFDATKYAGFCSLCDTYVSITAKHCGQCNRCVALFDHHCKWLNNCIGAVNYKLFVGLLVSLEVSQLSASAGSIVVLLSADVLSSVETALVSCLLAESVSVAAANGYLISLHIWLRSSGLTTYEYLTVKKRKREHARVLADIGESTRREKFSFMASRRDFEATRLKAGNEPCKWEKKDTEAADIDTKTVHSPSLPAKDVLSPPTSSQ